ncbi:MAG: hypothetical protein ABIG95_03690 [Candidatus Woesearchaeota archaeon]
MNSYAYFAADIANIVQETIRLSWRTQTNAPLSRFKHYYLYHAGDFSNGFAMARAGSYIGSMTLATRSIDTLSNSEYALICLAAAAVATTAVILAETVIPVGVADKEDIPAGILGALAGSAVSLLQLPTLFQYL